jgi:integrase
MAGRVHLKEKTVHGYKSLLETRIRPRRGTVPLVRVTNADVEAWVADMRREGLSASRTRQAYHLLSSMLSAAVRDRRLPSNPAAGVKMPRLPTLEKRYLTHDQLNDLARAAGRYELMVLVLGYCGLRYGEAAALRVRRVDTLRRRLEIVEAVTEISGRVILGTPKTHQTRSVPVPAFVNDRLVEHIAGRDPEAFVFAVPRGGVLRNSDFRSRGFDKAAKAIGLEGLVPHELRHTTASLPISSGATIKGVQAMLGHTSAAMTLDQYGHLFGDDLDAVATRLDAASRAAEFSRTPSEGTVTDLRAKEA